MGIPDFVVSLRERVGTAPLWLSGVTAVILDGPRVLLVRRGDTGAWAPVSGILEPGEEPAVGAWREAEEETGVTVEVERLVAVGTTDEITYPNGDRASYLDLTFRCRYVSGEARVNDDESLEVAWWPVDALPEMSADFLARIRNALDDEPETRFLRPGDDVPRHDRDARGSAA
ncbi:ADP-ribose pyrophosphatase YjhB (NUDIX family) [Clavibacter michiganensis]|uniref:NUDIX hydrolase n=1 Tax=Clavibacter michiganensis TaxID=28447 RepID=UPI001AEB82DC|nr:NUDIX domain-containing protein [Clavibacter michiganensis]MBP2458243.1 ADP-ribose pyrophosphatase YjhB (NUDIX family) [Clavibacter michiganensis]MDQ0410814.1 ADP-ribose pyrophosphatase YjhB (NUDIX family) [Clavibacter michiganensis]